MTHRVIIIFVILLAAAAFAGGAFAAEKNLKQISEAGITVTCPSEFEVQAKRILKSLKDPLQPSLEVHKQLITLLDDTDAVAREISNLLGAEEKQDETKARLQAYKDKSRAMVRCFSNIHLLRKSDAAVSDQIDAGVLQARYDERIDEFQMGMNPNINETVINKSFFPIFVNADGSIKSENSIPDKIEGILGSNKLIPIAAIHETVGYIMSRDLMLYYPLTRWFNEGVSGWVTRSVVTKFDPKLTETSNLLFSVSANSKTLKDKVNLLAWPQPTFQNTRQANFDPTLEAAKTQYAVELITQILGNNGARDLPKIVGNIKYNGNANTDAICETIKKITGKDAKAMLLNYVPQEAKDSDPKKLIAQAESLCKDKKWTEAAAKLRLALQITPEDVNARLNLAWLEREEGKRLDSEIHIFIIARILEKANYKFHLFTGTIEGNYVCGRLAIMLGNLESAKEFLEPVLTLKPDHTDAKRAMDEIRTIEAAARQTNR